MNTRTMVRQVPFLAGLSDDDLDALLQSSRTVSYPKSSIVFYEGDSADVLFILMSGSVKVVLQGERGQEITLNEVTSGGVLGEMALFDDAPRSATAVTLRSTEFLQIRREGLTALLDRRPAVAREILRHAVRLLREANETIRSLSMFDVHGRIVRCLIKLASQRRAVDRPRVVIESSRIEIDPKPSNQRLADMIGSSRETVSRAMKLLDETGFVRVKGRKLVIEGRALRRYWSTG
jgi:CRP/FNR family cyclic AMP-dependent transcriptional regulator